MEDELTLAQNNMVINKHISDDQGGHNSDDEISSPKKNSLKMDA